MVSKNVTPSSDARGFLLAGFSDSRFSVITFFCILGGASENGFLCHLVDVGHVGETGGACLDAPDHLMIVKDWLADGFWPDG